MKSVFLLIFWLITALLPLCAQEPAHSIDEVEILTDRGTRTSAVRRELKIPDDISFTTYEALLEYVENKKQDLINLRVFTSVRSSISPLEHVDNIQKYKVQYIATSTWTVYTRVTPEYDSNTGFIAGGELIYDNFFGTLTNFSITARGELEDTDGISQWSVTPSISHLTFLGLIFALEAEQALNEQAQFDGEEYQERYTYYSSGLSLETSLPILDNWFLSFSPGVSFYYGLENYLGEDEEIEKENWEVSVTTGFGFDRTDWVGNFRRGFSFLLSQTHSLTSDSQDYSLRKLLSENTQEISWHEIWGPFNPSVSLIGFVSLETDMSEQGSYIRGVRDERVYGRNGFFARTTLGIKVVEANKGNEVHLNPFCDIGLIRHEQEPFDIDKHFFCGAGADIIIYNALQKTRITRVSIGMDMGISDWENSDKFELTLNSSLAY